MSSATRSSWRNMLNRCTNPKHEAYQRYAGRGITVCERWKKFENFLADMGERPEGKTLDRFPNNDGNYEPGNCRWATAEEQTENRRPQILDLVGQRNGRVVVVSCIGTAKNRGALWNCRCDCGVERTLRQDHFAERDYSRPCRHGACPRRSQEAA